MKMGDIEQIETMLNITLPKELVEKYTSNLLEGIEEFPEIKELFIMDSDSLILLNKRLREKGLFKKPFPQYLYVIGVGGKNEYYLIDMRESPLRVFRVMNNKTWSYNPDDLSKNTVGLPPNEGIDSFFESYPMFYFCMKREQKLREELGIPELELNGEDINKILDQMTDEVS